MLVTLIVVIIIILYLSYLFSKLVAKNSFHINMICLAELSKEDVAFEKKEYDMENGSKLFQNSMIEKWKTKIKK